MGRESDELTELQNDIKATAEDIAADAERVKAIEVEKRSLPADHPRMTDLADQAESLAESMVDKVRVQSALVDQAAAEG